MSSSENYRRGQFIGSTGKTDQVSPQRVTLVRKRSSLSRQDWRSLAAGHSERQDSAENGGDRGLNGSL
jgi:hypothetical protein